MSDLQIAVIIQSILIAILFIRVWKLYDLIEDITDSVNVELSHLHNRISDLEGD